MSERIIWRCDAAVPKTCVLLKLHVCRVMSEELLEVTHNLKAQFFWVWIDHVKSYGEKLGDLRNVKLLETICVALEARMGFTPWEQLQWMFGAVVFFHTSEFLLALAYHGRRRVNAACKFKFHAKLLPVVFKNCREFWSSSCL